MCLAILGQHAEAVKIGSITLKRIKQQEVDISNGPDNLDRYEQETDVNEAMLFSANIAGFTGEKQLKISEMDDKKLRALTEKPTILTEDEAIQALSE
jgi:hypothetical protein